MFIDAQKGTTPQLELRGVQTFEQDDRCKLFC